MKGEEMKLFLIVCRGWGTHHAVVRAVNAEQALLVYGSEEDEVVELDPTGSPAILWEYEDSPDSPRDD